MRQIFEDVRDMLKSMIPAFIVFVVLSVLIGTTLWLLLKLFTHGEW